MKKIERRNKVFLGDRVLSKSEAREVLSNLRKTESACKAKINKVKNRISLIQKFIDQTSGEKITLSDWMANQSLDFKDYFTSIGYFTPTMDAVSNDPENNLMSYHKTMIFNPKVGFCTPNPNIVKKDEHNEVTSSMLGFTYNPKLAQYFPTTIYDTDSYREAEKNGDNAPHIMGGYLVSDMANFSAMDGESKELLEDVIDLYEDELDGVVEEYETVNKIADTIYNNERYYGADGRPVANSTCRTTCAVKHPFNKSKRESCQSDCDKKYPPTDNQEERREERDVRQQARQEKRSTMSECRDKYRRGELTSSQFSNCKKSAREEKQSTIKEDGGGRFFSRVGKSVAKVFPITLAGRGGALVLIKNNAFGFATRVAPALVSMSEAKDKFTSEAIKGAEQSWGRLSNAWEKLGGQSSKLREAILQGYRKKPMKISKNSSFNGTEYLFESKSNAVGAATIISAVTTGLATLASLITTIIDSKKNPYKPGKEPAEFKQALQQGVVTDPPLDPNAPRYDVRTGNYVDPETGRPIDPQTGKYTDTILGINKWIFIGASAIVATTAVILIAKSVKK